MIRNWPLEVQRRVMWIRNVLIGAHATGVILGLSGGKDSAVVAALCKQATPNVVGVMMPCKSIGQDKIDAMLLASKLDIQTMDVELMDVFGQLTHIIENDNRIQLSPMAAANIKPRLRMTTLYAIGQTMGYLVAGTGNRSETAMGYFTKWGDGACDFNPIADLTVREVLELGAFLGVPQEILSKAPSAGLWVGQTDEQEMGITYDAIDTYLLDHEANEEDAKKINEAFERTRHKRDVPLTYHSESYPSKTCGPDAITFPNKPETIAAIKQIRAEEGEAE
jgi:NAD+ synthase